MFALLLILSQALLLLSLRGEDELLLLSTGVRCETSRQCVEYFEREACKFAAHFCIDGACRAEPSRVCEARGDATCNSRNHRCLIHLCHNTSQCFRGSLCDGEEHCIAGRCVFRYTGGLSCPEEEEEEAVQEKPIRRVGAKATPTSAPTEAPILSPPPHSTPAPTVTPAVNVNLALIGIIVLAVVVAMVIFTLLIAAMSRTVVPYAIVNYDSQMIGGRTFLY